MHVPWYPVVVRGVLQKAIVSLLFWCLVLGVCFDLIQIWRGTKRSKNTVYCHERTLPETGGHDVRIYGKAVN